MISWAFEMTPEGMKRTADISADAVRSFPYWSRRKFAAFIISVAMIAAGLFSYQIFCAPRLTTAFGATNKTIAGLPLLYENGEPNGEYFFNRPSAGSIAPP